MQSTEKNSIKFFLLVPEFMILHGTLKTEHKIKKISEKNSKKVQFCLRASI
jgi:hypothetical protein